MVNRKPTALADLLFDIVRPTLALGYVGLGLVFLFAPVGKVLLAPEVAPYFGGALVLYGGFRLYRAIMIIRNRKQTDLTEDPE